MPKIDHPNIGDVAKTKYLTGTITALTALDTCSVLLPLGIGIVTGVPIYYHCTNNSILLSSGALEGSSGAFAIDDQVIVQIQDGFARVMGHADGAKRPCVVNWNFQLFATNISAFVDPGDFVFPEAGFKFTISLTDKGDLSSDAKQNVSSVEYGKTNNFLGFSDGGIGTERPTRTFLGGVSEGGYDAINKIMFFNSNPSVYTPAFPSLITGILMAHKHNTSFTYKLPLALTGYKFLTGDEITPREEPYIFKFFSSFH